MRIILHLDMDAFFASVEERDKPRLKGRPLVVGADPAGGKGRGVVSTANYIARKYGIKSAMPISKAWELSQQAKKAGKPEVVFMGGSYAQYAKVSKEIFSYVATKGDAFEPASVDEAYLELTYDSQLTVDENWQRAEALGREIKNWIKKNQQLTCSVGIGPNKLIAKIAAGMEKPDGLTVVRDEDVQAFLDPLSVRELMGIGPKTAEQLRKLGIEKVHELRAASLQLLEKHFGKHGEGMYRASRGISDSPIVATWEAKSVGRHHTFYKDTLDGGEILPVLREIAAEIAAEVHRDTKWFRTVTLTVRFSNFVTYNRSHTIETPSQEVSVLETEGMKLLLPFLDSRENPKRFKLRLIGLRAEKFVDKPKPMVKKIQKKQAGLF